jgi:hypothetical protein
MVAARICHHGGATRTHQAFDRGSRGLAVENEAVHALQVACLHPAIQPISPRRTRLTAAQEMDHGDEGIMPGLPELPVEPNEGRVVELVLEQDI